MSWCLKLVLCVSLALALPLCAAMAEWGAVPADSAAAASARVPWRFSVGGSYYALPYDEDFLIAVAIAEHGSLHLEARYNYEDRKTGSVFAGWTISGRESFTYSLTPMAGVAFGRTTGVVPALEAALGYGIADLYAETEYLLDLNERTDSFFYSWLELGLSPFDVLRVGLVAQRTRLFQTPLVVDRGPFVQVTPDLWAVTLYAFNLFTDSWFLVVGARIDW